jgi:hypothetical protein
MITIELLGVARLLARREVIELPALEAISLAELLSALASELPALVGTVVTSEGALLGGYALSRDGVGLLREPLQQVEPGDRLLLLSTSAGG